MGIGVREEEPKYLKKGDSCRGGEEDEGQRERERGERREK